MRQILAALVLASLSACATHSGSDSNAKEQVTAATAAWADAFNNPDPSRVAALYDPGAVLWGTTSKTITATPAAVADYFKDARAKFPDLRVAIGEQNVRVFGDVAVNSGTYRFFAPKGELLSRFTFVFHQRDGKWLIVDHHSSRIP